MAWHIACGGECFIFGSTLRLLVFLLLDRGFFRKRVATRLKSCRTLNFRPHVNTTFHLTSEIVYVLRYTEFLSSKSLEI
jgi:hypothetical protein